MTGDKGKLQVWLFLCGVGVTVLGILLMLLSGTLFRNWIIIEFGIRSLSLAYIICAGIMFSGLSFSIVRCIPLIKARNLQKREQEQAIAQRRQRSQIITNYNEDSANPEFTRKRLEQLRDDTPQLALLIEKCLSQMDVMDILQEKQSLLIETNDALYLKDTVAVFDKVERRICQNFRNIINLCIATDDADNFDLQKVNKCLDDNERKLSNTKRLLKASAEWINQYNTDGDESDRSEVENWINVIRDSLKEED